MKRIITFAGAVGCSKTPTAHYLSCNLGLPILNNDTIRTEIIEDMGEFDQTAYDKLRIQRTEQALMSNDVLIYDASVDRAWEKYKANMTERGIELFVISFDLSRELLVKLYKAKGYDESLERLDLLLEEHDKFLSKYSGDTNLRIDDEVFPKRLELALEAATVWLNR